jgi:hypothetical protein
MAIEMRTYDALSGDSFVMHSSLITAIGDMPAMLKLLGFKGHSDKSPPVLHDQGRA